jgi:hypothetical protein
MIPTGADEQPVVGAPAVLHANDAPAIAVYVGDRLDGILIVEIGDGRITRFYAIR